MRWYIIDSIKQYKLYDRYKGYERWYNELATREV